MSPGSCPEFGVHGPHELRVSLGPALAAVLSRACRGWRVSSAISRLLTAPSGRTGLALVLSGSRSRIRSCETQSSLEDKQVTSRSASDSRQQRCGFGTNNLPLIVGRCGAVPRAVRLRMQALGAAQHRLPQWFRAEISRFLTALLCCLFSLESRELSALIVSNSIFSKSRTSLHPLTHTPPPRTRRTPRGSRSAPSSPRGARKALKPVKTNGAANRFTNTGG